MNKKEIVKHAIKYFQKVERDEGFAEYNYGINYNSSEYLKENLHIYAARVMEKKELLGKETREFLYEILGAKALEDCRYSDARRYFLLAGRKNLLEKIESEKKKRLKIHQKAEEIAWDPNHYKNN